MFKWPTAKAQPDIHVSVDENGGLIGLDSSIGPAAGVCIHLPSGLCLLRRLAVSGLSEKEIELALELWAEDSLPGSAGDYALDSWAIGADSRGLVAVPRLALDRARQQLADIGATLVALMVPELCPAGDPGSVLMFWPASDNVLVCFWDDGVLYEWQSFLPGPSERAMLEQTAAACKKTPAFVYWNGPDQKGNTFRSEMRALWSDVGVIKTGAFDQSDRSRQGNTGPKFANYVYESQRHAASGADKLRLVIAAAGALLAGLFLFHADVAYRERRVEQLSHEVSLLKIKANRSEKLAARSGKALRQIRELRAMTIERNGVMKVLQALGETLPPRVKIESIGVERSGSAEIDGVAETEVDISRFLEGLRQSALLGEPSLSFSQKDEQQASEGTLIRFRMETRLAQPLLRLPRAEASASAASKTANVDIDA